MIVAEVLISPILRSRIVPVEDFANWLIGTVSEACCWPTYRPPGASPTHGGRFLHKTHCTPHPSLDSPHRYSLLVHRVFTSYFSRHRRGDTTHPSTRTPVPLASSVPSSIIFPLLSLLFLRGEVSITLVFGYAVYTHSREMILWRRNMELFWNYIRVKLYEGHKFIITSIRYFNELLKIVSVSRFNVRLSDNFTGQICTISRHIVESFFCWILFASRIRGTRE